jgi:hypothetical protein
MSLYTTEAQIALIMKKMQIDPSSITSSELIFLGTHKAKEEALSVWKQESGYTTIYDKIQTLKEELEELEKTLPAIPAEYATSKTDRAENKGIIVGEKVSLTCLGHHSKHDESAIKKQNLKDAKWVCGSIRNIACPHGNATDGTIETKFVNLYEFLKINPVVSDKDLTEEIAQVKDSTYTKGCRFMCRTKDGMEKHLLTCKHSNFESDNVDEEVDEDDECGVEVVEWTFDGEDYLVDEESNVVYSVESQEEVGKRRRAWVWAAGRLQRRAWKLVNA